MIRRAAAAGLALLVAACATAPVAPDPSIDLRGRWTIVAVDGEPTGGGRRFNLELNPAYGSAQFGCNSGSGAYRLGNGWFYPADPWIITAAGCPDPDAWLHFERKGYDILAKPLAIQPRPGGGVRLRNAVGSIDLVPAPPVTAAEIAGNWIVTRINDVPTLGRQSFQATITMREFEGRFGCNRYSAEYRLENGRFTPVMARHTEMACEISDPETRAQLGNVPLMTLEEWAFAILRTGPEAVLRPGGRMALVSPRGTIEFARDR